MQSAYNLGTWLWERRDPRVKHHLMQGSPTVVVTAIIAYLLLVTYGPRMMKGRKTPPLYYPMALYNVIQVVLSGYMLREFVLSRPRRWLCSPVEITDTPNAVRLANACWLFHISKLVDFLDTVFLVLKKDHKRLTYLHVFHHASMFFSYWLATLFTPGGSCWLGCAINSFVHCVMYSYYFLAALGPTVRRYLWWKRYLTQLQMVQFSLLLLQITLLQTPGIRCGAPLWAGAMTFVYLIVLTGLFLNFYIKSYRGQASAARRSAGEVKVSQSAPDGSSVGPQNTIAFAWKMMQTHGFGCFAHIPNKSD